MRGLDYPDARTLLFELITSVLVVAPIVEDFHGAGEGAKRHRQNAVLLAFAGFGMTTIMSARRAQRLGLVGAWGREAPRSLLPGALAAALAIYVSLGEGIPYLILVLAGMALFAEILMRHTRYGPRLYAVGGNPEAARLSGISLRHVVAWNSWSPGSSTGSQVWR